MLKTGYELTNEQIIELYNQLKNRGGLGEEFLRWVLSQAGDLENKTILDAGCGYGELLSEIAKRTKQARLYGVDLVDAKMRKFMQEYGQRIIIKNSDIQRSIPFEDNFFDLVFCTETLEHLKYPECCISELRRVVKASGMIIFTLPNASGYFPFYYFGNSIPTKWLRSKFLPYEHPSNTDQPIDTCYSFREIMRLLQCNQLHIQTIQGWRYFRYLQTLPFVRTLYQKVYPFVEQMMNKMHSVKFAYNLLMICRK